MLSSFKTKLNRETPIPLYYQLKEILIKYIKENPTDIENPIPSEVKISVHFDISRPTVRQAINELIVEGYLYRVRGKGTFIEKPKINMDFLLILDNFNNEMKKKGFTPSTKVLVNKIVISDEKISKALQIPIGSKVIQLNRLRFADNEPNVYVITYLPYGKCPQILDENLEIESLYDILERKYNLVICKTERTLEATIAGDYEAKYLKISKGAPIQFFESITYIKNDIPIEYSLAKYRGDRNKFSFELKK